MPVTAILVVLVAAAALWTYRSRSAPPSRYWQKLVILGFDGMDPDLVAAVDAGRQAAEHASGWSIRAASIRSARRTRRSRRPRGRRSPPASTPASTTSTTSWSAIPRPTCPISAWCAASRRGSCSTTCRSRSRSVHSIRGGTSFWVDRRPRRRPLAASSRCRSRSRRKTSRTASCSSGLPLPDIRGTMGTFYYFATDLSRYEEGNTEFGGILKRLVFENDVARTELDRPAQSDRPPADRGDSRQGSDAVATPDRSRARRAAGARGRAPADDDPLEPRREDRDRRDRRPVDPARARQVEQVDRPRLPHQLPRPACTAWRSCC